MKEGPMISALVHAYDLTTNAVYLNQAQALFADVQGGWDTTCCGAIRGGMWWDKAHTQKATAANAGAASLSVHASPDVHDGRVSGDVRLP